MHFTLRLQGCFVKKLLEDGTFICSGAYETQAWIIAKKTQHCYGRDRVILG